MTKGLNAIAISIAAVTVFSTLSFTAYGVKKHRGSWDKVHPRQNEVNERLQNQTDRATTGEANGALTKKEGNEVKRQDRAIFKQEQRMKERNGGNYLTKGQQEKLNKEEDKVSHEIKHDEATSAPAPGN